MSGSPARKEGLSDGVQGESGEVLIFSGKYASRVRHPGFKA